MTKYIEIDRLKYLLYFAIKHIVKEVKQKVGFAMKKENEKYKAEINMLVNKVKYLEGLANGF